MARLIDADAVYELFEPFKDAFDNVNVCSAYSQTLNAVANAPTIDAAEVVRCKDCKWYNGQYCFNEKSCFPKAPKADDFCNYGERKETDHD